MNPKQPQSASPPEGQISLADVYYVLFKRKWLILICAISGFIAAGVASYLWHPSYQSTAKLMVNYIAKIRNPLEEDKDSFDFKSPDSSSVLASQIQILKSFDSAKLTANIIQPSKILAPYDGGTNEDRAAQLIMANLVAEPVPASQILLVTFTHRDFSIVQAVLQQMITNYQAKEEDLDQKSGEIIAHYTRDQGLKSSDLNDTRQKLAQLESEYGIVDLPTEEAHFQAQEAKLVEQNFEKKSELEQAEAIAEQIKRQIPASSATNSASATNAVLPPAKIIADYKRAVQLVSDLNDREKNLDVTRTSEDPIVQTNLLDIQAAEKKQQDMEDKYPGLVAMEPGKSPGADAQTAYQTALDKIEILKIAISNQMDELQQIKIKGTNLVQLDSSIRELVRKRNLDEADLQKIEDKLGELATQNEMQGKDWGIQEIEFPTPPARDLQKAPKVIAGLAAGGVILGIGLAFLLEMVLDRSFKRPQEITGRLKLPFFLAIPYTNGKMKLSLPAGGDRVKLLGPTAENSESVTEPKNDALAPAFEGSVAPWDEKHALRPFHETLRDRLIAYFEEIGLTHKPKLVAVTSCDDGAGVSTIASGLASSLSETGEGNVLLVSMNSEDGEAQHFYKGKLTLGIDEVLHKDNRSEARVLDNLYVVKETSNSEKLPSFLPKRFGHLVDKMKASDYDYIIFDMPPVTQISVTPRLARFMDTVLLVVEAEKTHHDVAQRAAALLVQSRANVGVVMNKTRSYVPKRLLQEL